MKGDYTPLNSYPTNQRVESLRIV